MSEQPIRRRAMGAPTTVYVLLILLFITIGVLLLARGLSKGRASSAFFGTAIIVGTDSAGLCSAELSQTPQPTPTVGDNQSDD